MANLLFFMTDVETGGSQSPVMGEMTQLGTVLVTKSLKETFYYDFRHSVGEKVTPDPSWIRIGMENYKKWIKDMCVKYNSNPVFISDNNGFDFSFVSHNFWKYLGENPFGHSSQNLGSLYKGFIRHFGRNFKHLRITRHTHHPVDDAMGNAEAFLTFAQELEIKIPE